MSTELMLELANRVAAAAEKEMDALRAENARLRSENAQKNELLPCGHPKSLEIVSVESDYRSCELCETRNMQRDAEAMEIHHRKQRDSLRAENARLREALEDIAVYGCGMLSQPPAMNSPEETWLRMRIREYEKRARAALSGDVWSFAHTNAEDMRARMVLGDIDAALKAGEIRAELPRKP